MKSICGQSPKGRKDGLRQLIPGTRLACSELEKTIHFPMCQNPPHRLNAIFHVDKVTLLLAIGTILPGKTQKAAPALSP